MPTPISLSNMDRGVTGVSKKVPLATVVAAEEAINKLPDLSRFPTAPVPQALRSQLAGLDHLDVRRIPLNQLLGNGAETILAATFTPPDGETQMMLFDAHNTRISSGYKEDGMTTFNFGAVLGHVPAVHVVKGTG
jgi:hypothetical protein